MGCIPTHLSKTHQNTKSQGHRRYGVFQCDQLTEVELSEDLQSIERRAFACCIRLRRIAIPLRNILFGENVFIKCVDQTQVDLVGEIHKAIPSLLLESWRDEMNHEIGRINQVLPSIATGELTEAIQNWLKGVIETIEHYKSEHYALLKGNMTQLELALWKSKLYVEEANLPDVDAAASRHDARVKCVANIIIPHVLSFLNDVFPLRRRDNEGGIKIFLWRNFYWNEGELHCGGGTLHQPVSSELSYNYE